MLRKRILTALVLLAVLLPTLIFGQPYQLGLLLLVLLSLAAWEWTRLLGATQVYAIAYGFIAFLSPVIFFLLSYIGFGLHYVLILALAFWCLYVPHALYKKITTPTRLEQIGLQCIGLLILPLCWAALMGAQAIGNTYLLSLLATIWAADIGAYFVGKAWGRHHLASRISPGKTIEGALGGFCLALGVSVGLALWGGIEPTFFGLMLNNIGWIGSSLCIALLVAASVMGDLFESLLKRRANVKDSSHLLPGHGGILDRIDALLPAIPFALFLHFLFN